jgi:hypothetical protein
VASDIEQGEVRHSVVARDAICVETSGDPSTALVLHFDNGSETECASQVHWQPYAIVGDAGGVQHSASVPPQDKDVACGNTHVSQVHWHPFAIVGDASGIPHSASVPSLGNVIACGDLCATQTHWRPYAIVGDASGVSVPPKDNVIACEDACATQTRWTQMQLSRAQVEFNTLRVCCLRTMILCVKMRV